MKKITIGYLFIMALFIFGCATTHITTSWKAPEATLQPYHKIMVVGVMPEKNRALREKMEAHLVGDLKALGYNAFSSLQQFGPKALDVANETQMNETLRADSVDAVLTIVLLDKERERFYEPGRVTYTPYSMYYNRFWPYYHTLNLRIGAPGYYTIVTRYFWESNFYDLHSNQLLYSVQTQSFDPGSAEVLGHEHGKLIVQDMVKKNVLANQTNVHKVM